MPAPDGAATVITEDGPEPIDAKAHAAAASDGATPPRLRAKVFARDGQRCKSCGAMRTLHAHHLQWRSRGGKTVPDNLLTLCAKCHGLIHEGLLMVAPLSRPDGSIAHQFENVHGNPRDHFAFEAPFLRVPQCAPEVEHVPERIDAKWLAEHLDWFDDRGGKLTLKPRYRDRLPASPPPARLSAPEI